jgi:hypothetical protein
MWWYKVTLNLLLTLHQQEANTNGFNDHFPKWQNVVSQRKKNIKNFNTASSNLHFATWKNVH